MLEHTGAPLDIAVLAAADRAATGRDVGFVASGWQARHLMKQLEKNCLGQGFKFIYQPDLTVHFPGGGRLMFLITDEAGRGRSLDDVWVDENASEDTITSVVPTVIPLDGSIHTYVGTGRAPRVA